MNPNLNAFLASVRSFLLILGGLMVEQGLDHTTIYKYLLLAAGSVVVVGNGAWAVWSSYSNWRKASAVGVAAGVNMAVQGKAVADDGTVISKFNGEGTPPKPVTVATAAQIVKDFAPTEPIAKS